MSSKLSKRAKGKIHQLVDFEERLSVAEDKRRSVETLKLARAVALAGLPKRRTDKQELSRTLRLGKDLWLRATYFVKPGETLPFGGDRFVLAGIQHLALKQDTPMVEFDRVRDILDLFGIQPSGRNIRTLRERFERLSNLAIDMVFSDTEEGLKDRKQGDHYFVIRRWRLPTKNDLLAEAEGQRGLPMKAAGPFTGPYGVQLNDEFWEYLQDNSNLLVMPLDLVKLFLDSPTGWDYCSFLISRCGSARSASKVPHEALVSLFRDSPNEPDRKVMYRLQKYHDMIVAATGDRLNARFCEDKPVTGKRGRPKKRWSLEVGPSKSVLGRLKRKRG